MFNPARIRLSATLWVLGLALLGGKTAAWAQSVDGSPPSELPPPPVYQAESSPASVQFSSRDHRHAYMLATDQGPTCALPCTLPLHAGLVMLHVSGPGNKLFLRQLVLPPGPSQVTVQHLTLSRVIAGSILSTLGLPAAFFGTLFVAEENGSNLAIGIPLLLHGVAFTVAGIIQLATIRPNEARVTRWSAGGLQLKGASIDLTRDRSGAVASVGFAL